MKRITLLFAVLLMYGCSVESTEEFDTLDAKVKAQNEQPQFEVPILTCGTSTESSLELTITAGENTGATGGFRVRWMTSEDFAQYGWDYEVEGENPYECQEMFQVTGNNADYALIKSQEFPFMLENFIDGSGESCDRALACGMEYVFKVQALNESGKDGLKASEWSENLFCSTTPCEVECTSGYMIGSTDFATIGGTSKNWGWAHQFSFDPESIDSETREIHHKNGSLGGEVTISYNNGVVEIIEGAGVNITHLYISNTEPEDTNAPGQFDKNQFYSGLNGNFWLIIKAEVCN